MSQTAREPRVTYAEYLALEMASAEKHELWDGEVFAMSGGTFAHSLIAANLIRHLGNRLEGGPCRVFTSDTRIRPQGSGNAAYPDVAVICGEPTSHDEDDLAATNPTVVIEVLSESTERFDRGDKFAYYRQIDSLRSYVLVSQQRKRVEVYDRDSENGSWVLRVADDGEFHIGGIDVRLEVEDVYKGLGDLLRSPAV